MALICTRDYGVTCNRDKVCTEYQTQRSATLSHCVYGTEAILGCVHLILAPLPKHTATPAALAFFSNQEMQLFPGGWGMSRDVHSGHSVIYFVFKGIMCWQRTRSQNGKWTLGFQSISQNDCKKTEESFTSNLTMQLCTGIKRENILQAISAFELMVKESKFYHNEILWTNIEAKELRLLPLLLITNSHDLL